MSTDEEKTWRHEWKITRDNSTSSKVQLSLILRGDDGNDRMNTQGVPLSSLTGFSLSMLDHDGPIKFEYVRDSGRILCEGTVTGGHAAGPFTVALDPSFVSELEKMGYTAPRDDEAFSLVISDVTLKYAHAIKDTGLTSSISDLVELEDHGVGADYVREVRQEGFTNLSAGDISDLRDHGVKPDYLKAIKAAGPNLSIEEIDSLYDHGVKPDYYKCMVLSTPSSPSSKSTACTITASNPILQMVPTPSFPLSKSTACTTTALNRILTRALPQSTPSSPSRKSTACATMA